MRGFVMPPAETRGLWLTLGLALVQLPPFRHRRARSVEIEWLRTSQRQVAQINRRHRPWPSSWCAS